MRLGCGRVSSFIHSFAVARSHLALTPRAPSSHHTMTVEENSNLAYGSSTAPGYTQVPQSPYLSASAPPMGAPYQQVAYPGGGGAPPPGVMYAPVSGSGVSVHVVQTQAVSNDVVGPIVVLLVGLCCPLLWYALQRALARRDSRPLTQRFVARMTGCSASSGGTPPTPRLESLVACRWPCAPSRAVCRCSRWACT